MTDASLKPSRISRLIQPRKSTINNKTNEKRSLSEESDKPRYNSINLMASGKKRSRSVLGTPMQTPRLPPRTTLFVPGTCDNQEKRQINERANRILEMLRSNEQFGDKFLPGGLRTMSVKQFSMIMKYFLDTITGTRFKMTVPSTPDDIIKFLTHVQYPYMITKSCLKTPTAPHTFGSIVEMLGWLCELIDYDDFLTFEDEQYVLDSDRSLPDPQYVKIFRNAVKKSFHLWNNKQYEEYDASKQFLVNEFIHKKTGHSGQKQIETETKQMECEYKNLIKNRVLINTEHLLVDKQLKIENQEADIAQLKLAIKQNKQKSKQCAQQLIDNQMVNTRLQNEVKTLKQSINNQQLTVAKREQLITELNLQKQWADSLTAEHNELKNNAFSAQTRVAQLSKRHLDLAAKLNKNLQLLTKQLSSIDSHNNSANQHLPPFVEIKKFQQQIPNISSHLQWLNAQRCDHTARIESDMVDVKIRLAHVIHQSEIALEQRKQSELKCAELRQRIEFVDKEIADNKNSIHIEIDTKKMELTELQQENQQRQKTIANLKLQQNQLEQENKNALENLQKQSDEVIAFRQERLAMTRTKHEELKTIINQLGAQINEFQTKL